ncbi:MAG: hypothetical protein Q8T04_03365, partial [Bacteroidota bacterium]|nr:hypothetical protein [Bacteroidota bacterium]
LLFHSMKSKQKSCQNEPSAGRFDGLRTHFDLKHITDKLEKRLLYKTRAVKMNNIKLSFICF